MARVARKRRHRPPPTVGSIIEKIRKESSDVSINQLAKFLGLTHESTRSALVAAGAHLERSLPVRKGAKGEYERVPKRFAKKVMEQIRARQGDRLLMSAERRAELETRAMSSARRKSGMSRGTPRTPQEQE